MENTLNIDIETYSTIDIKKAGMYRYAQSEDFEILIFAYSLNGEPVKVINMAQGEVIPQNIINMLNDGVTKLYAYNAAFEWYCLNQAGYTTNLNQWQCTMIKGLYCGYPSGLGAIAKALNMPVDKQKDTAGKALIKYFSVPCTATKTNGGRVRNLPRHDPDKWKLYLDYCGQDVVTEMAVLNTLSIFELPTKEWELWRIDILMNEKGVEIDRQLVENAISIDNLKKKGLLEEAKRITDLSNPASTVQLLKWLQEQGLEIENLKKETVAEVLKKATGKIKKVLQIKKEISKTSTKKYNAMFEAVGVDNRVRGLLQFYGANRTGRWAGRLVQVQNLPRNYLPELDDARNAVLEYKPNYIEVVYGSVSDTLSQLIRTAFVPKKEHKFIVADFSAIEARVIAWLAKEEWRLEVFKTHGKIYEASASQMFGVDINTITKGHDNYSLRQKGKVAELALGYQGSCGALVQMGALNMGLTQEELPEIVSAWRNSNKRIVDLWYALGNAAIHVVETCEPVACRGLILAREVDLANNVDFLTIELPSKRKLYYANPKLEQNSWGQAALTYDGMDQTTKKWTKLDSYGGKLVENVVQAIARDCLAENITRLTELGHKIVMHIHDEVVIEAPMDVEVDTICDIMGVPVEWAPDLLLTADGFETKYYKKD